MSSRSPRRRYEDPLDAVWLAFARALGLRVERSDTAYATWDGRGTLSIGTPETLDADDCLAQMIFHEACHALVQGDSAFGRTDWGLDNTSDRDAPREHATLRLQAFLAQRHGLRGVLAPTTDYRAFWDALPADPLQPRHDPTVALAILGARRSRESPWAPHLHEALAATASILRAAGAFTTGRTDAAERAPDELPPLWRDVVEPRPAHPTGLPAGTGGGTCGDCGWRTERAGRRGVTSRCLQAGGARIDPSWPGCERWEPALDCLACGACCRAAYDLVITSLRDPVVKLHPELVIVREDHAQVVRAGDRCAALCGGAADETLASFEPYTCVIYEERPRPCRGFPAQSLHCLVARRRVGMSL